MAPKNLHKKPIFGSDCRIQVAYMKHDCCYLLALAKYGIRLGWRKEVGCRSNFHHLLALQKVRKLQTNS